jgi:allantoinase
MWTNLHARGFTLQDLARLMSEKPAQLAQLTGRKGRLAAGYDADLVIFDPEAEITITANHLHTRHAISPYIGETLRGKVIGTYLRGKPVFEHDQITTTRQGIEV